MNISESGIDFIKEHEGLRLTQYLDSAGKPTIGYGHLIKPTESLYMNRTITMQQAEDLLVRDLQLSETTINSGIYITLNQNQFDALVSLVFNIGTGAFASSTVKGRINNEFTQPEIDEAWKRFNKVTINGVLVFSQGLANRRDAEVELYNSSGLISMLTTPDLKKKF